MILRAKTTGLKTVREQTSAQILNSLLNDYEMDHAKSYSLSFPKRLVLELTNRCNQNCIICDRENFNQYELDFFRVLTKFKEIFDYISEVTLFGYGEPSLYSNFEILLKFLNQNYPQIVKYFVTNGKTLGNIKKIIFDNRVDIIGISLDGAKAETNDRIRKGSDFKQVINDISEVVKFRNFNKLSYPYLNFVFVAMNSNLEELPEMVKLTADLGMEELKVVYFTAFKQELLHESLYNQKDRVSDIFNQTAELAGRYGVRLKLPYLQGEDPSTILFHKPCFVGWRDLFISSNGSIRPCQSCNKNFGNINDYKDFRSLWNSDYFKRFRSTINTADDPCEKCYQSSHSNVNTEHAFIQIGEDYLFNWED